MPIVFVVTLINGEVMQTWVVQILDTEDLPVAIQFFWLTICSCSHFESLNIFLFFSQQTPLAENVFASLLNKFLTYLHADFEYILYDTTPFQFLKLLPM